MLIHIMTDWIFNDEAIAQFEAALPGGSEYLVLGTALRFTKSPLAQSCSFGGVRHRLSKSDADAVVFHSLPYRHLQFLSLIAPRQRTAWLGWGFDYYPLISSRHGLGDFLLPRTRHMLPITRRLLRRSRHCVTRSRLYHRHILRWLSRIDVFAPVLGTEFPLVRDSLGQTFRASYVEWNYGRASSILGNAMPQISIRPNIVVGNSATSTNNHADVFAILRKTVDISRRKVIVPLTYGNASYRRRVIRVGKATLGDSFVPLTTHMPLPDYLSLINSCGFMFLAHLRQQAFGNAVAAVHNGLRLHLHKKNPLWSWFDDHGAYVADLFDVDLTPLEPSMIKTNQRIVSSHFNDTAQWDRTRRLVGALLDKPG